MKRTLCLLVSFYLVFPAATQEISLSKQSTKYDFTGLENIHDYFLKRNQRIIARLNKHLENHKNTGQLPDGITFNGNSVFVHGGKAPELFQLESAYMVMTRFLHDPDSEGNIKRRLLHRGMAPSEISLLMKLISGENNPQIFMDRRAPEIRESLRTDYAHLPSCNTLAYDAVTFEYAVKTLAPLSLPARRAVVAYLFEFGIDTASRGYSYLCFPMGPESFSKAITTLTKVDENVFKEIP